MAKKSSTIYLEEFFWDMINEFQAEHKLSSRNDAIQVILSEWNILRKIDFNNIKLNVSVGNISHTNNEDDSELFNQAFQNVEDDMPD